MKKLLLIALSFLSIVFVSIGISSCTSKRYKTIYVDGYGLYFNGNDTYTIIKLPEEVLELREWTIPENIGKYKISGLGQQFNKQYLMGTYYWEEIEDLGKIRKLNIPKCIKKVRAENLKSVAIFQTEGLVSEIEFFGEWHKDDVWFLSPQEENVEYQYLTQENIVGENVYIQEEGSATFLFSLGEGSVEIAESYKDCPVEKISSHAFSHGTYTDIKIGKNIKQIGTSAFYDTTVDVVSFLNEPTSIGNWAFSNITAQSISLPEGVLSIGKYAFYQAEIVSITLPQSLVEIQENAFERCKIPVLTIPNQVTEIKADAFAYSNLGSITLSNGLTNINSRVFQYSKTKEIKIPDGVTSIEEKAFFDSDLESVSLPSNLVKIGADAFGKTSIQEITLPQTLERIETYAFHSTPLKEIKLPASLTYLGRSVFSFSSLESIDMSDCALKDILTDTFMKCPLTELILPDCCEKLDMSALGDCVNLKKLHLANADIISMSKLPSLEEVTISETNENLIIKDGILYEDYKLFLGMVVVDKYKSKYEEMLAKGYTDAYLRNTIPYSFLYFESAYEDIQRLLLCPAKLNVKKLVLSDVVLGENAFYGNAYLEEITLNLRENRIPNYAFSDCTALKKVTLSENITVLGKCAFYQCSNLLQINLGGIRKIEECAFKDCSSLKEIDLTSVTHIGGDAFYNTQFGYRPINEPEKMSFWDVLWIIFRYGLFGWLVW